MAEDNSIIPAEQIAQRIYEFRNQKVMLDSDLAELYGIRTFNLNKAVKRNANRFPEDFMFQLNAEEYESLIFQIGISKGRGGRRHFPFVFTEHGVAMLSSVLQSPRAVRVNIEIMRAFVRMRRFMLAHEDLASKIDAMEQKYDAQFQVVFDALRKLIDPPDKSKRKIGFETD